jgi:hypothetical protein
MKNNIFSIKIISQLLLSWLFLFFIQACTQHKTASEVAENYLKQKIKNDLDSLQSMQIAIDSANTIDLQNFVTSNKENLEPKFVKQFDCNEKNCTQVWAIGTQVFILNLVCTNKNWKVDSEEFINEDQDLIE